MGDFGSRPDDVMFIGKCDEVVRDLCRELGWEEELDNLWAETESSVLLEGEEVSDETKVDGKETEEAETKILLEAIETGLSRISIGRKQPAATVGGRIL